MPSSAAWRRSRAKSSSVPSSVMDGLVAARRRRRWPRGCRRRPSAAPALLLGPLRSVQPMGWIGGRYRHVEAHRGDVRQARRAVGERAMVAGLAAGGARKQLVPARETRELTFHLDRQRRLMAHDDLGIDARSLDLRAAQFVDARVLAGGALLGDVALPGRQVIDPGDDGEFVTAELAHRELRERSGRCPARAWRRAAIRTRRCRRNSDRAGHEVVTVGEHVRRHAHRVAAHPLDRRIGRRRPAARCSR